MGLMNREQWLMTAFERLVPTIEKHGKVPDSTHVLCSWPSKSIRKTIGMCYQPAWAEDGSTYITISPLLKDPRHVLHTLLHEMVHAVGLRGHGKKFKATCEKVGLVNEGSSSTLDEMLRSQELELRFTEILKELGEYKHVAMVPPEKNKEENGEEKKKPYVKCTSQGTGYWVYVKTSLFEKMGPPLDPTTKQPMEVEKDGEC